MWNLDTYLYPKIIKIFKNLNNFIHNFNKDKLKVEFQDSNPQEFKKSMGKWRRSYKVGEYGNYLKDFYSKNKDGKRNYSQLIFVSGMRGGKTTLAAMISLY